MAQLVSRQPTPENATCRPRPTLKEHDCVNLRLSLGSLQRWEFHMSG